MNRRDAKDIGVNDGDGIRVISSQGEFQTKVRLDNTLLHGMLFMPLCFPSGPAYELFSTVIDPQTKAPALKSCAVRLERTAENG